MNSAENGDREMEFDPFHDRDDGEYNGVGSVEFFLLFCNTGRFFLWNYIMW